MQITALRFANVVGPWSWHKKGAVTAFFKAIMADQPIVIFGDGSATRDFLFVDDLCAGIKSGLESPGRGFTVYHLAGGREVSVRNLAEMIRRTANRPEHPITLRDKRRGEVERNFANYDRAKADLGFKPRHSLEQALIATWEWMQHVEAQR